MLRHLDLPMLAGCGRSPRSSLGATRKRLTVKVDSEVSNTKYRRCRRSPRHGGLQPRQEGPDKYPGIGRGLTTPRNWKPALDGKGLKCAFLKGNVVGYRGNVRPMCLNRDFVESRGTMKVVRPVREGEVGNGLLGILTD
jgi:hypothetical protein